MKFYVILCLWIVVIFCWVDLGNLIDMLCMIVNQYTTLTNGVKFTLLSFIETLDEINCTLRVCMVGGK